MCVCVWFNFVAIVYLTIWNEIQNCPKLYGNGQKKKEKKTKMFVKQTWEKMQWMKWVSQMSITIEWQDDFFGEKKN
mgnify:CR=1 FL=1